MKKILIPVLLILGGVGAYVGLNWSTIMTGFMTAKIDPSAQITVKSFKGALKATRYEAVEGKKGNEAPLKLTEGMSLKPNDKIISDGNETEVLLELDPKNTLRLRSADFILKSLFGEESDAFTTNVEEGELILKIGAREGREIHVVDTNKNRVEILGDVVECYLAVTSFEGTLNVFVKSGEVKVSNSKGEGHAQTLKAGAGLEIDEDGGFKAAAAEAEWVKSIAW